MVAGGMIRQPIEKSGGPRYRTQLHHHGGQGHQMETKNSILTEEEKDRHYDLLFGVRRSIRYHNRRRQFFDRVGRLTDALSAISGSGTIIALLSKNFTECTVYLAGATAIFSAVNLVWDTKGNSRLHHDLARQFISIEKRLIDPNITPEQINKAESDRLEIEAGEPPILRVLDLLCHNELIKAMGLEREKGYDIKIWRAMFAHFFDFFPSSIKPASI